MTGVAPMPGVERMRMSDDRSYSRILLAVLPAVFLYQFDTSVVTISLPSIAGFFDVSTSEISYVVLAYLLVVTGTMLLFGKLTDRLGSKRVFVAGLGIYVLGSLLCGVSSGLYMLIASRCVQGLGGSIFYTSTYAVVSRFIPPERVGRAFGLSATISALGITLGSPIGGLLTSHLSWQWIFLVQAPIGLLIIAAATRVIPCERAGRPGAWKQFDYPGALMSLVGLLGIIYALSMWQELGLSSPIILGSVIASPIILIIFILWEKNHPEPLLHPGIFKNRALSCSLSSRFLCSFMEGGSQFLMPFFLIHLKDLRTEQASLIISMSAMVCMLTAPVCGILLEKRRASAVCSLSMLLASVSCSWFIFTIPGEGLRDVIIFLAILAASFGFYYPANNKMIMMAAPQDSKGIASGLMALMWVFGSMIGVSVFESTFNIFVPHDSVLAFSDKEMYTEILTRGFYYAYLIGILGCLGAIFFSQRSGSTPSLVRAPASAPVHQRP